MAEQSLKLYLETSIWNVFFDETDPFRCGMTKRFIESLAESDFEVYLSESVILEVHRAPEPRRTAIFDLIESCQPFRLHDSVEIDELARSYLEREVFPAGSFMDARHVATAVIHGMDCVVSWNLKHIANVRRREKVVRVNEEMGYSNRIVLCTPMEVLPND